MLSRPSSLLRPPPTPSRLPATSRIAGYRQTHSASPQDAGRGGPLQFPRRPVLTFHAPCAGGVPRHLLQGLRGAFHGLRPYPRARLSLAPAFAGHITTLQASLHAADRQIDPPRFGRRHFGRPRGLHYRGPWRLPGPDLHRLVVVSFSLGYVMFTPLHSWRPSCWTHGIFVGSHGPSGNLRVIFLCPSAGPSRVPRLISGSPADRARTGCRRSRRSWFRPGVVPAEFLSWRGRCGSSVATGPRRAPRRS